MYWILLLGLALAWILQTILIRRMWQQGLSVELRFRDRYIYEGDSCALQEIVTNDKWIPLPQAVRKPPFLGIKSAPFFHCIIEN